MRLTLDALTVLDAIDRNGSFAAAAEELHRVPSAMTYAVQKLEQDLGVSIFDRRGHRAKLTPVGQALLRDGRHLLNAAMALEQRVKRLASGWETELRIAVSDLIPLAGVLALVQGFDQQSAGTQIRLSREVFGGNWDALLEPRVDLVIGAPGDGPPGAYRTARMGDIPFVFAVAPQHPLARHSGPLSLEQVRAWRAVVAADSSRRLPPRSSPLLAGQDILTVPDMDAKLAAQQAGLGVGFLPRWLALPAAEAGALHLCQVEHPNPPAPVYYAWRERRPGRALAWFLAQLALPDVCARLLGGAP